jgi:hypothetical protein
MFFANFIGRCEFFRNLLSRAELKPTDSFGGFSPCRDIPTGAPVELANSAGEQLFSFCVPECPLCLAGSGSEALGGTRGDRSPDPLPPPPKTSPCPSDRPPLQIISPSRGTMSPEALLPMPSPDRSETLALPRADCAVSGISPVQNVDLCPDRTHDTHPPPDIRYSIRKKFAYRTNVIISLYQYVTLRMSKQNRPKTAAFRAVFIPFNHIFLMFCIFSMRICARLGAVSADGLIADH